MGLNTKLEIAKEAAEIKQNDMTGTLTKKPLLNKHKEILIDFKDGIK